MTQPPLARVSAGSICAPLEHQFAVEVLFSQQVTALGAVSIAVKGYAAPETGEAYARARELWEKLGSPTEFLQIPFGQSRYYAYRGELDLAQRLDEDLLRLSRQRDDAVGLVLGHYSSGRNLMPAGEFARSRSHLERPLRFMIQTPTARLFIRPESTCRCRARRF